MRARSVLSGFLLAAGSGAAAVAFRRRSTRRRARAEVYLADGSRISLSQGRPGADSLLAYARELLATARS